MNKKTTRELQLAELIMDVVPKTMQSIRHDMRQERSERLTLTQFRMLASVNRGLSSNKELGDKLGVSEAAVSRMVDILVQEKLIKKSISAVDRRNKVLALTSEGKKLFEFITGNARARLAIRLEALSEKEKEAVILGLEVLQKNLDILQ